MNPFSIKTTDRKGLFINIINVFKSMLISVILLVLAGSELIRYEFKL